MNAQNILEQFLGPDLRNSAGGAMQQAKDKLANSGMGGVAGGLAAGGLLGVLLSNKKARKSVGKLAGIGGAAALGALAFKAYQNYQANQQNPAAGGQSQAPSGQAQHQDQGQAQSGEWGISADQMMADPLPADSKFNPSAAPASDGKPFELALVMAMIGAANADGHIGPDEQKLIFTRVGELPLDADDKAFVFDALGQPPTLNDVAALADGPEQAAELYLASRLAIEPDHPAEKAYLEALAARLSLPSELVAHLEDQVANATA